MWAAARGLRVPLAGLWALRGGLEAAIQLGGARGLRGSAVCWGSKRLLKKFASKTRKKFWYEGPSLGSDLTYKPSKLELLPKKASRKTRKEDQVRLRALNGLLYKALTDLLCTPEVSQEIYNLNVELSQVSLTSDFSACRVYWKTGLSAEQNAHTEATLQKSAAHMRHILMSQQTLRNVPPIVFIQDRKNAALAEVERLLAVADFGPADESDSLAQDALRDPHALSPQDSTGPATHLSVCGIDHEALNKQIMEYKRRKEEGSGRVSLVPLGPSHVAELTSLVRRKRKVTHQEEQDISPRSFLQGEEDEEEEDSYQEAEQEWGAKPGSGGRTGLG